MKEYNDLKAILYREADLDNTIVRKITGSEDNKNKEIITFVDEEDLGNIIDNLKTKYRSKEILILKEFRGRKFQKCPGSQNVICCNYYLLNTCFDCLYNCTYCFLNSYLNSYGIVQFINLEELLPSMNEHITLNPGPVRIGTGEFTDSLMFDHITGIAEELINGTARDKNIFLEFKTKSDNVDHLLSIKEKGSTVLAWTLNTPENIRLYEEDTATLEERFTAAKKAQDAGYLTAFHFDPIIRYDNFLEDYFRVIDMFLSELDCTRIAWISLGCFRYSSGFKDIIKHSFPSEKITVDEMFPGVDGKYRYLTDERISIFKKFREKILSYSEVPFVYMCMEDRYVWQEVFGADYNESEDLELDFMNHLKEYFISP